jgi:hypothetical protein
MRGRVCLLYMLLGLPNAVFLGSESLVLATIFYCLRFETSHFVASYDSQGHGGSIRPRLHTGLSQLSVTVGFQLYNVGSNLAENTSTAYKWIFTTVVYCCKHYLATGCLPRIRLRVKMFIEPLLINESINHNILITIYYIFLFPSSIPGASKLYNFLTVS